MFSNVLSQITGRLDSRFILTLFFPSLLFWGGLAAVYAGTSSLQAGINQWRAQPADLQLIQIVIALSWVTFFAYLVGNQMVWLAKQFEGYWGWIPWLGKRLAERRQRRYQKVVQKLADAGDYEQIYYRFPWPDDPAAVMPTQLGNILKNSEQYAYQRYDMDTVLLWPRLYAVLPEAFKKTLEGAKASLDFMLVVSTLSGLFALIGGVFLWVKGATWVWVLACFMAGWLVAYLAYRSALEAAVTYGQLIKSASDLYRDNLRQQMGFEKPGSLTEERNFWRTVYELLYRGEAADPSILKYTREETKEK